MNPTFDIRLVSRKIWQPIMTQAFAGLADHERSFAQTIVTSFHNRHVGIPPALAASLAQLHLDPSMMAKPPEPWGPMITRLRYELGSSDDPTEQQERLRHASAFGFSFLTNPSYSALRIFMPLFLELCRQIDQSYLFCDDEVDEGVSREDYLVYSEKLSKQVDHIVSSREDKFQLFWKERAITLSSLSRQSQNNSVANTSLPEMDPVSLRLLLTLNPSLSTEQTAQKLPHLTTPLKRQRSPNRKEGGVDGVHVTRRMEEINNILLSEFINPHILLADRILNTGFMAIERPSERVKLRDVLIAAMMPVDVQHGMNIEFLKACWFDCLMHLSVLLRQHKLHQSEFRWIEGDAFDRIRSSVYPLGNMPVFESEIEEEATQGYRHQFLNALQWLPTYLDRRSPFRAPREKDISLLETVIAESIEPPIAFSPEPTSSRTEQLEQWISTAWREQNESAAWQSQQPTRTQQHNQQKNGLAVDDFAYVHVMLFLPASQRNQQLRKFSTQSGSLKKLLRLNKSASQHISITWVPDHLAPNHATAQGQGRTEREANVDFVLGANPESDTKDIFDNPNQWAFEARGRVGGALFAGEVNELSGKEMAKTIETAWQEQLLKEMWRG